MRPVVERILADLLIRHREAGHVHLNDITEVIGPHAVTYEEVEHLIVRLEEAGLRVGEPLDGGDIRAMRAVLDSARRLRSRLQRAPTVPEIAEDSGYPPHAVRRALEHGAAARGKTPPAA